MKITLVKTDKQHHLCVTNRTMEHLLARMLKDDSKFTLTRFRDLARRSVASYDTEHELLNWHHVYPAAEFQKDANGNLEMKACNGLLLLTFRNIKKPELLSIIKREAAFLPSTYCAVEGVDSQSVEVIVRFTDAEGCLPTDELEAEALYRIAYRQILPIYQAVISLSQAQVASVSPSLRNNFFLTLDANPYFNAKAVALKVDKHLFRDDESMLIPNVPLPADWTEEKEEKGAKRDIQKMMDFLSERYEFRYNTVMKYTEFVPKAKGWWGFRPVDPIIQNSITLDVQRAGINVSIRDVKNFVNSTFIKQYNPVDDFMMSCYNQWDGKDHIRALARTVPTNCPYWEDWFYIWFLAMVDQWRQISGRQYGNSVAPLLISKQGFNKSTFCRRLLPQELQWGYNDNLILTEKRQVLQAMSQFLLINLDEFNQISPKVQQGFLKNLIQLPSVKIKPPYGSHVTEFPRTASFIATSNMDDILTDPSGNRRFIGIELTGPIDVSLRPNYHQLFAQAEAAIRRGERTYFDAEQTALIMENNQRFQQQQPIVQCFLESFAPANDEKEGEYMTAAAIFGELKARYGSSLEAKSLLSFGRVLKNIEGLKSKRTMKGAGYLVVRLK